MGWIAGRFTRVEPRRRVQDFVLGLLSDLPRKNCWTIAEWTGEASPTGMRHLIGRATSDTDAVRDDVREWARQAVESTFTSQVIRPFASSWAWSWVTIRTQMPSRCQRRNRS